MLLCSIKVARPARRKKDTRMDILLIGCGKMGGAMLDQWIRHGDHRFTVADPAAQDLPDGVGHVSKATDLQAETFDVVLIAIKPQMIADVLPDYAAALKPGGAFVSIAAGASVASIAKVVGDAAIIRVMPNMAALVGMGVSGLYANDRCTPQQRHDIAALIDQTGTCIAVDSEDQIDRLTAVSGSGPGYVFEMLRSYVAAAEALGFDHDTARKLVFDTVSGTVEAARQSDLSLEELRNSVTSKNGTTQAGLTELMRGGDLDALFHSTLQAAHRRAGELK